MTAYFPAAAETYAENNNITFKVIDTPKVQEVKEVMSTVTPGTYDSEQNIVLSTATAGAVIYYTTDDSEPQIVDGVVTN